MLSTNIIFDSGDLTATVYRARPDKVRLSVFNADTNTNAVVDVERVSLASGLLRLVERSESAEERVGGLNLTRTSDGVLMGSAAVLTSEDTKRLAAAVREFGSR